MSDRSATAPDANTVTMLVTVLVVSIVTSFSLTGCASGRLRTTLYSMAKEDALDVRVYDYDTEPHVRLNGSNRLPRRTRWSANMAPLYVPQRLLVEWEYGGESRRAVLNAADHVPNGRSFAGDVIVLIEGENARLGWRDCTQVAWEDLGNCPVGGVLAEPPYAGKNIFDNRGRPFVNGRQL